jgi:hypothetical protein
VCDAIGGSIVESGKLEAAVEGSSNELELSADDPRNKTMEGSVKTGEYAEEECGKCI